MATKKTAAKAVEKKATAKKVVAKAKAPAAKASVADLIKANNKALGAAVAAGNAGAVGKMYTKTARLLPPDTALVKGTKAITAFWQGAIDSGIKGATLKSQEVEVLGGSTAIEVGSYTLATPGGPAKGKYIVVWKKDGKEWKLHRDIFNSDGAPAAPAASEG